MLSKTLLSLVLFCCASVALAQGESALDAQIRNIERLLDMRSNINVVRLPNKALDMADALSEPELFVAAMVMSANPEIWLKAMEQASEPGTFKNFSQLVDPQMLADWFYASIDPRFQNAILSRALDPKKLQRWMSSMNDPRFFLPAIAVINPATPMQWVKVTANGRLIKSMQNSLDHATRLDWMRLQEPTGENGDNGSLTGSAYRPAIRRY